MSKKLDETMHCLEPLPVCLERLDNIEKQVNAIHQAVLGNGDPRRGLADRVSRMEMVFKLLAALLVVGLAVVTAVAAWK